MQNAQIVFESLQGHTCFLPMIWYLSSGDDIIGCGFARRLPNGRVERHTKTLYAVLLARGVRCACVYVCDEALLEHLRAFDSCVSSWHQGSERRRRPKPSN